MKIASGAAFGLMLVYVAVMISVFGMAAYLLYAVARWLIGH